MTAPDLAGVFHDTFGIDPVAATSAPGRINIIGEHTDYSDLPVLPAAVQQRVRVAASSADDGRVVAVSAGRGEVYDSDAASAAGWTRYVASVVSVLGVGSGARMAIGGDLPDQGGLSSSSALTVAVVAALLQARDDPRHPHEVVRLATAAERGTGVEGGAMDQTVIVHARSGHALRIDFGPLRMRHVPIPESLAFVAGYSGELAAKGAEAMDAYNARVVGVRAAAALLGAPLSGPPVLATVAAADPERLPETTTARGAAAATGCDLELITTLTTARFDPDRPLPVRAWARHVLGEARRVDDAEAALAGGDVVALGALLDASQRSLAADFAVSTPGLDRVVAAARGAGARGARLTGAGFGGWAIAVTDAERAASVAAAMGAVAGGAFVVAPGDGLR